MNDSRIFNQPFLKNVKDIIFTENPLEALSLIQSDNPNTTFLFGSDSKYIQFINEHRIKKAIFTFNGKMRLFYELSKLTEYKKDIGIRFLQNPHLIDEIEDDYTRLGYVRERKKTKYCSIL